jgi:CDP-diglyceride synthetase
VDHGDDRRTDQGTSPGAGEDDAPTSPSGRVRIVGAERAFDATAVVSAVPREEPFAEDGPEDADDGRPSVRLTGEPGHEGDEGTVEPVEPGGTAVPRAAEGWNGSAVLPHWTEPPTGQVPAVLERDRPEASAPGPTWREEHADWDAHDQSFDAALFAPEEDEEVGSLDESGGPDLERRPWEFDLPEPVARGREDEATQPVPAVPSEPPPSSRGVERDPDDPFLVTWGARRPGGAERQDEPEDVRRPAAATTGGPDDPEGPDGHDRGTVADGARSGTDEGTDEPGGVEEVFGASRGRPSGTVPVGRMRRGTMRMPRVRAKRPEDADTRFDEPPLAASPPGAAVTAVPGAGRRRGGIADLAAADREGTRRVRADGEDETGDEEAVGVGTDAWAATGGHAAAARTGEDPEEHTGPGSAEAAEGADGLDDDVWEPDADPRFDELPGRLDAPARGRVGRRRSRGRGEVWGDDEEDEGAPPTRRGRAHASASRGAEVARARRIPPVEAPGRRSARRRDEDGVPRGGGAAARIVTGVVAAAVALAAFAGGSVTSLVLVAVVVTFAAGEAFGTLRRVGYRPATLLGLVGTVSLLVGAYTKGPQAVPLVLVLVVAFTFAWYLFGIDHSPPLAGVASTLLVVGWISLMGAFAALLLAPSAFPHRHGVAFLLGAIIATVANDVGALVFGAWLGRRPLAPRVSPNKTWEGLIGGTIVSIVVSVGLVGAMHPWTPSSAAVLGVVVSIVAPIGDLSESLLKRDLRTKDMGRLLPGHGGVLDRVDAMLFVLPATYYLVRVLNLG